MAYGQIINNLVCAGGPPGVLAQAHTLGSAAFCAFATHDITTVGPAAAGERIYCPTGGTRLAAQVTFNDATVAGMLRFSTYLTTAYSLVDIGPIVGQTRAANQVSAFSRVGRPSYRSRSGGQ